jgi:uncharacterized protein YjiS (DUF1127 family)
MTVNTARALIANPAMPASPSLISWMNRRLAASLTRNQLRSLDDRMLWDIGLTRADIETMRFMN